MPNLHLPGVYLYGALSLVFLFVAHLQAGNKSGVLAVILSAGLSYLSSAFSADAKERAGGAFAIAAIFSAFLSLLAFL